MKKSLRTCFTCMSPGMSLQVIRSGELSLTGFTLEGFHTWREEKNLFLEPNTFWKAEWHQLFLNFQKSGFLWSCSETCRVPRRVHSCFSSQAGGHGHHHLLFCDFKKSSCLACSSRPPRTPEVLKWAVLIFQTNIKHKKMLMNLEWTHK